MKSPTRSFLVLVLALTALVLGQLVVSGSAFADEQDLSAEQVAEALANPTPSPDLSGGETEATAASSDTIGTDYGSISGQDDSDALKPVYYACYENRTDVWFDGIFGTSKTITFQGKLSCRAPVEDMGAVVTLYRGNGNFEARGNRCIRVIPGTCVSRGDYFNTIWTLPGTTHILHWDFDVSLAPRNFWVATSAGQRKSCDGWGTRNLHCTYLTSFKVPL